MIIENGSKGYRVEDGAKIGENEQFRAYLCTEVESRRQCLLLNTTDVKHNGVLDRNAFVLADLKKRSDDLEAQWTASGLPDSGFPLNYHLGFPELVDNFVFRRQENRRINVIAFSAVEDLTKIVPVARMVKKDRLRVDLKTSVWMMGKLLKLLEFTHSEGITSGWMDEQNLLLQLDQHYVIVWHWMKAQFYARGVPEQVQRQEVQQAAKVVITALGGNAGTEYIPDDGEEHFQRYSKHLLSIAKGNARGAAATKRAFYELVDELWERKFHPYKTYPI